MPWLLRKILPEIEKMWIVCVCVCGGREGGTPSPFYQIPCKTLLMQRLVDNRGTRVSSACCAKGAYIWKRTCVLKGDRSAFHPKSMHKSHRIRTEHKNIFDQKRQLFRNHMKCYCRYFVETVSSHTIKAPSKTQCLELSGFHQDVIVIRNVSWDSGSLKLPTILWTTNIMASTTLQHKRSQRDTLVLENS